MLVQQKHRNKFSTTFDQDPVKVIKVNGSQIVFEDKDGKTHRRNSAHVKKIQNPKRPIPIDEDIEGSASTPNTTSGPGPATTPNQAPQAQQLEEAQQPHSPRRSNRKRKPPDYYKANN